MSTDDDRRLAEDIAALIAQLPPDEQAAAHAMIDERLRDLQSGDVEPGSPVGRETMRLTFEYFLAKVNGEPTEPK